MCTEDRLFQQKLKTLVLIIVVIMCDGHAVSMSQNGGRHPLQQQAQESPGDGPLAALARCGALAAAGNGCTTAGRSVQRPPPPPARAAPGRPTAPPPPPPPAVPPNGIGDCTACERAERVTGRACVLSVERRYARVGF